MMGSRHHRARRWALVDSSLVVEDGTAIFRIGRELKSPNKTLWAHWRVKQRERQDWERDLGMAFSVACAVDSVFGRQLALNLVPSVKRVAPRQRSTVTIRREVPSRRNFIRDDDNLAFAAKFINDALKRLGFIYDDSRQWLTEPPPIQALSADGRWWTHIEITPWWLGAPGPSTLHEDRQFHDLLTKAAAPGGHGDPDSTRT